MLFVVGCDSGTPPTARTPQTPTASPFSPATSTIPRALELEQAWGNVKVHTINVLQPDNRVIVFQNVATPDGEWLLCTSNPREPLDKTTRYSHLCIYNIATGQIKILQRLQSPQSQVLAAAASNRWVVWSESADQPNFFDWKMFAYNLQSGAVRVVAQAAIVNGKPVVSGYPFPSLDGDHLTWGQAVGPIGDTAGYDNAVVRLADLSTGAVTKIAKKAELPRISWPWAVWHQQVTGTQGVLVVRNLDTGEQHETPEPASMQGLMNLSGSSLTYADTNGIYVVDDITQPTLHPQALSPSPSPMNAEFPTINDRLIAWDADNMSEVYDRLLHVYVTLPIATGHIETWVGNHTLLWIDQEAPEQAAKDPPGWLPLPTIYVLDTRTLPTTLASQ